jgi:hypothetical protein
VGGATNVHDVIDITAQTGETPMFRKTILAVAATTVIAVASLTPASAHEHHFGWGGIGFGLGLLGASIAASNYYAPDQGCYQYRQVLTRHGYYRTILVNVCE